MNLLVINPGSTSTKIAVYENDVPRLVRNIRHTVDELSSFSISSTSLNSARIWC